MEDKMLKCRDCNKDFTWTKGEQEFYQQKGFENPPSRCPDCRRNKKREGGFGGRGNNGPRQSFEIICSKCGKPGTVPFKPSQDREVLCRDCFGANRG